MTTSPIKATRPLSYMGLGEVNPPDVFFAQRPPLTTDVKQYDPGDIWIDDLNDKVYILIRKTNTVATWESTALADFSLTGNSGAAVEPDPVWNINVVGTATNGINVVGNPATFTMTIGLQSPYSDGNFRFANDLFVGIAPTGTADLEVTRAAAGKVEVSINNTGIGTSFYSAITQNTGGDCYSTWTCLPNGLLSFGIDHSDSDKIKITGSANPSGGVEFFVITRGAVPIIEIPVGLVRQEFTNIGADVWHYTLNNDNTNAASNSFHEIGVGGAVAGDPFIKFFINGVQAYSLGIDNSDSDKLKITDGFGPSAGTVFFTMTTGGASAFTSSLSAAGITDTTRTQHAVSVYGASGVLSQVGPLTNGQLIIGSTGATPAAATLTAGGGISITNAAGSITIASSATGVALQKVATTHGASVTSADIPYDNTIPQNTEGDEIVTLAITPTNANNILEIEYSSWGAGANTNASCTVALFQDATVNALMAGYLGGTNQSGGSVCLRHRMVAGTTSSTTFKIRMGGPSAGNHWNVCGGSSAASLYGGACRGTITITEYQV